MQGVVQRWLGWTVNCIRLALARISKLPQTADA